MKKRLLTYSVKHGKVIGTNISMGTEEWIAFCRKEKAFRFIPEQISKYSLIQEILIRNRNGAYWYAYRKVNNKQRAIYIGKPKDICWEKLQEAAEILSLGETEYALNRKLSRSPASGVQKNNH